MCRGFHPAVAPFSAAVEAAAAGWRPSRAASMEHGASSDGEGERVGNNDEEREQSGEVAAAQASVGTSAVVDGGEKPFACSLCDYHCSVKSHLVRHERSGDKPFACSQCEYRCSSKSHLVQHERVHSSDKPFACSLCAYRIELEPLPVASVVYRLGAVRW